MDPLNNFVTGTYPDERKWCSMMHNVLGTFLGTFEELIALRKCALCWRQWFHMVFCEKQVTTVESWACTLLERREIRLV